MKHKLKHKKRWIALCSVVAVLLVIGIGFGIYVGNYYHATDNALLAMNDNENYIVKTVDDTIAFIPEEPIAGLIFYPGGKVEHTAYAPLAEKLAERDVLCVICKMPFHLAVFDINAADDVLKDFPEIKNWYIGGHSLGGAMAASYVSKHYEDFDGLILFGAYSTADLSDTGLKVVSVYGSEDQVLNKEKYDANKGNLPTDFTELIIVGGCHAYFGDYGPQDGDGNPTITLEEQLNQTVDVIMQVITSTV